MLVLFDEFLLAGLKFRKRLKIFESNACLKSKGFDELFIFRLKFSILLIQNLENTDDFTLRIAERHAQYISCLESGVRIDRGIEQRRFVRVLDDHLLTRDENGTCNSQARVETDRVLDTNGSFG